MNVPYVKKLDENGNITNFPKGGFTNPYPNRHERRKKNKKVTHNYNIGGCMARDLRAVFVPSKRTKIKGYMKNN